MQVIGDVIDEMENGLACESPIESRLCWQLRKLGIEYDTQKWVGNRRLDIVIGKVNVECDGKNFHNEQTDLRRDIEVLRNGFRVIRVAGREIMRNPKRVAWVIGLIADENLPKLNDVFSPGETFDTRNIPNYPYDMMLKIYSKNGYFWIPCDLAMQTFKRH